MTLNSDLMTLQQKSAITLELPATVRRMAEAEAANLCFMNVNN